MMTSDLIDTDIGPDTVVLVFRDAASGYDAENQANVTERLVTKTGCLFEYDKRPAEDLDESGSASTVRRPTCRLPVDSDSQALKTTDAIRFDGNTYEMQGPAVIRYSMDAGPDHVYADLESLFNVPGQGEEVTIIPHGGRDDDGNALPAGTPFVVTAFNVNPGATSAKFEPGGEVSTAVFTIILPPDTAISDDDWVIVRGRTGRARVQKVLGQYADRNRLIVTVDTVYGGGR